VTEYLSLTDLLAAAPAALQGADMTIRDVGLLEAALARPQASAFGEDAYPDLETKAAALLSSLVSNHALVDGNKRLGWMACRLFLRMNGQTLDMSDDDAVELVLQCAQGQSDVQHVAATLRRWVGPADSGVSHESGEPGQDRGEDDASSVGDHSRSGWPGRASSSSG
jgi:death-on-curing protein